MNFNLHFGDLAEFSNISNIVHTQQVSANHADASEIRCFYFGVTSRSSVPTEVWGVVACAGAGAVSAGHNGCVPRVADCWKGEPIRIETHGIQEFAQVARFMIHFWA